jgi:hypothetical protein
MPPALVILIFDTRHLLIRTIRKSCDIRPCGSHLYKERKGGPGPGSEETPVSDERSYCFHFGHPPQARNAYAPQVETFANRFAGDDAKQSKKTSFTSVQKH